MSRVLLLLAAVATVAGLALLAGGLGRMPVIPEGPALTGYVIPALGLVWAADTVARGLTAGRTRTRTTK